VMPVKVVPLMEYWKSTVASDASAEGTVAVRVTDVPTTCGDAGVTLEITIELADEPVVTTKAKGALVEDAYVALPE